MTLNQFIMSKKRSTRIKRHVLFWLTVYVPVIGISCVPLIEYNWDVFPAFSKIFFSQYIYVRYLVVDIAFSYLVAYYLIPKYIPNKQYVRFGIRTVLLLISAYLVSGMIVIMQFNGLREPFILAMWKHTQTFVNSGPVVRCALFLFALALKNYYVQVERRIDLLRETAGAELQLLKAQVHPHFLFNTLNNIYSFMLTRSPLAGQLLDKLSTTMHYMITDCEATVVPLTKEVAMLNDYIGLEKVRYGNRLRIQSAFSGNTDNYLVAPLLLIPFIENAFKHGASKVLDDAWIVVELDVRKNRLHFYVSNSTPPNHAPCKRNSGIGLKNARKRLELLYGKQYVLDVEEEERKFTVRLEIPVTRQGNSEAERFADKAPAEFVFS